MLSRSRRAPLRSWLAPLRLPVVLGSVVVLLGGACGPRSSIDRDVSGIAIGGAMRGTGGARGNPPVTPAPESPGNPDPRTPTSIDPPPGTDDGGAPPASDAGTADVAVQDTLPPPPPLSDARASGCADSTAWKPGGSYLGGERVTHGTPAHLFECRAWPAAPWCALPAYEPASAEGFWTDAWIDRGRCD